jgi:hypothetical protein
MFRFFHIGGLNAASRRHQTAVTVRRPAHFSPRLDVLEGRTLPSTLTVSTNADSGGGSLRAAIASANSGDSIVFLSPVHRINLTGGELVISKSLNIDGPGANRLTISGNDVSRVFDIAGGVTVTLSGLTLAHGLAPQGGAIDNAGNLAIRDAIFSDNHSVGGIGGGAIDNQPGAGLTLSQSSLTNNTATAGAASDVFGGALLNQGSAIVSSSTFEDNEALGGGNSGTFFAGSQGGAIDNFGTASLTVTSSTFANNEAVGAAGLSFGVGGAIENNAGFDFGFGGHPGSTATLIGFTFTGNLGTGGTGSTANGGAICNEGLETTVTISDSTLTGNRAIGGPGGDGETTLSQGIGGGILNAFGSMTVSDSTIRDNQAVGGDHSTPTLDNPVTGGGIGGGIANLSGGTLTVLHSILKANQARGGVTDGGPGGSAVGGGIDNSFSFPPGTPPSTLTVSGSQIIDNVSIAGRGGPGVSAVPAGLAAGGGIDDSFHSIASLTDCTLRGNQAIGADGGPGANGGTGLGGAISVGINVLLGFTDASSLTLTGCALTDNQAAGGKGGNGGDGGDGQGGGVAIVAGSAADVHASTIEHNAALGGKRGAGGSDGHGVGGGVFNDGTFTFDISTVIKKNRASTSNDDIFP